MEQEFGGIGRTWWYSIILMILASALLYLGKVEPTVWETIVLGTNVVAGVKSMHQRQVAAKNGNGNSNPAGNPGENGGQN